MDAPQVKLRKCPGIPERKCGEEYPLTTQFWYRDVHRKPSGLQRICKKCQDLRNKTRKKKRTKSAEKILNDQQLAVYKKDFKKALDRVAEKGTSSTGIGQLNKAMNRVVGGPEGFADLWNTTFMDPRASVKERTELLKIYRDIVKDTTAAGQDQLTLEELSRAELDIIIQDAERRLGKDLIERRAEMGQFMEYLNARKVEAELVPEDEEIEEFEEEEDFDEEDTDVEEEE